MRFLSEPIARQANKEDKRTGRFYSPPSMALTLRASQSCSNLFPMNLWEGRFTFSFINSQALLDEAAVLVCMAYVDHYLLIERPIRAKMARTPETSDYTSIQRRINSAIKGEQLAELLSFVGSERVNMPNGLMFSVKDYIMLVEDTGHIIREDKRGAISSSSKAILNRMNIPAENWLKITTEFGSLFKGAVGALPALTEYCEHLDRKRRQGAANCQRWLCA
jgi:hypothetical protein